MYVSLGAPGKSEINPIKTRNRKLQNILIVRVLAGLLVPFCLHRKWELVRDIASPTSAISFCYVRVTTQLLKQQQQLQQQQQQQLLKPATEKPVRPNISHL